MATFLVIARDKPGAQALRLETRAAHLEWVRGLGDRVRFAGPMLSDDGARFLGSALCFEAEDRAGLEALLAQDPYARVGLFESVEIVAWRWLINPPA